MKTREHLKKIEKKKFQFWEFFFWLQYRYQNWALVSAGFGRTLPVHVQNFSKNLKTLNFPSNRCCPARVNNRFIIYLHIFFFNH